LSYINFAGINAAGAAIPFTGTSFGDLGNNTNITFTAGVNKYWSLAAGGNWNSVAWATTSGGTPNANNYPLPQDTCIIENTGLNVSATIAMNVNATFTTINMSTRTNAMTLSIPDGIVINVLGDWINGSGLVGVGSVINSTGGIYFSNNAGGTSNITSAGKVWSPYIYVNGNVTVKLLSALVQNAASFGSALNIIQGSINLNGFNWTCSSFISNTAGTTRSISFGSNFISLANITAGAVNLNIGNSTGFSATGAGGFIADMSITRQFAVSIANGTSPSPPNLFINAGASIPTFVVESCFTTLDFTGSTCTPAAGTVDVYNLVLAAGGTYTNLTVKTIGTGTITPNAKTLVALNCSSGTTTLSGTLTAPTTVTGGTLVNPLGAILNAATFTLTTGTVNLTGGTLPTTATFTHTAGTLNVTASTSLTATSTYSFASGAINLSDSAILSVGIFSSAASGVRSIAFGSVGTGNINLTHTTAATTVLSMDNLTGFTRTGLGGFTVATMTVTRTFTVGTTAGATSSNAPNLAFTTGASIATITSGSWFNTLDYGTTSFTQAASTLNVNSITLSATGTYTALILNIQGTGTLTGNSKTTAAITLLAGTLTVSGTISCTTFTINGPTFNFTSGTLNPSTGFTLTSGSFTYGGTAVLGATAAFTHTAGSVTLNTAYALTATGTYTFTAGTLTLGANLTTGIFSSSGATTRSIAFGSNNIILATTTALQTVLNMADATNFTYTTSGTFGSGTGGFQSTMSTTRTFQFGTTSGGSAANAPILYLASGVSIATITTGGWYKEVNFGTTAFTIAATNLNLANIYTVSSTSVLTALTATMVATGTIYSVNSIGPVVVNTAGITTSFQNLATNRCTTLTVTQGTVFLNSNCTLICSSTCTLNGGTLTNDGQVQCTTLTIAGSTYSVSSICSWIISTSIVITSGSLTANFSAAGGLGSVPTFTHTAGTVTFNTGYSLTATGTYTFTAGTLTLADGVTLNTGIFSSSNINARSIALGNTTAGNINLTHTTALTTVLSMADVTNFTYTGPGGFTVADMGNTRTLTYGTTGGTTLTAVNLTFTTGASVATITTGGWFKNLNFGTTTFNPGTTTLNIVSSLTLSSGGTYLTLTPVPQANVTYTFNSAVFGPLAINTTFTVTLGSAANCTTFVMTAGTLNFASFNLTCSSTATYNGGTLSNFGTLACTTFTNNSTLSLSSGAINPTVSFVQAAGSFTIGGTATIGSTPLFTHTAGTVTFNTTQSIATTGTYTFTAGTLTLADGVTLNTGIFSSTNANTRSIAFGSLSAGNINLTHTTAATVVLSMAIVTGFTYTGPGGFTVADMGNTRTLTYGTTGGSITNAPNLTFTTGASIATLTTASWFKNLNFGTTAFNPGTTTLNIVGNLTLSSGGVYTATTINPLASGTYRFNGTSLGPFTVNTSGITITLADAGASTTLAVTLGTLDFASFNFTCSSTATYNGGTLSNIGTISCTTFTINGPAFNFTSGTINPSTGFTLTSGSFTLGGAATIGLFAGTFTHTAGTVTFNKSYGFSTVATYLFTAGTLNIASGFTMYVGILSSANTNTRSIAFGTSSAGYVNLTGGGTILSMATVTGFTWTGPGGFQTDNATFNISTLSFGNTAGGSTITAPNLSFTTASGSFVQTITTGSWFNNLDFGTTAFDPGTTALNIVGSLTLSSAGAYSALTPTMLGTGTITSNSKTIPALIINSTSGTTTLGDALSLIATGTTTLTSGTLALNGFNLSTGIFSSSSATTRAISFGTGNINLTHTTAATVVLSMAIVTGFTYTGTGGFTVADMSNTRTFTFGTTGGSVTNAPNLTFTTGASVATLTTASWFKTLSFGTTAFNPGITALNLASGLTLSSGGTFTTLTPTILGTGTITSNSNTTLVALIINSTSGTTSLGAAFSMAATGTVTLTSGALALNGFDLTTGIFSSSGATTRSIAFGTNNIVLAHTTAATTVLSMADVTNFTYTGTGGFTANASITRTYVFGTTSGSTTNAPNLAITTGAAVPSITTGSWFNLLNFTGTTSTPAATTVNLNALTLAVGGTFTNVSATMVGTGTITPNGKTIAAFTINNGAGTATLSAALSCTTYTQTAGTIDFATFNLTCSSTATYTAGTLSNIGTISCTTFNVNGAFAHTNGTITPSVSFVTIAAYTQSGTSVLSAVPTFTQTAGNVTFRSTYALTATGTYTLTAGTLTLGGNLTTGIFASTGTTTRAIAFSTYNIILAHTTAATTVLSFATATGFTYTGTGGFTADASVTRTFTFGTTGGSITNAPNLSLTGSGTAIQTFTTGSWFNTLSFGTVVYTVPTTTINLAGSLTLSVGGTYTGLSVTMRGTGTINCNNSGVNTQTLGTLLIWCDPGTITSTGYSVTCTNWTLYTGTFDCNNINLIVTNQAFFQQQGAATLSNIASILCNSFVSQGNFNFSSGTIFPTATLSLGAGGTNPTATFTYGGAAVLNTSTLTSMTMDNGSIFVLNTSITAPSSCVFDMGLGGDLRIADGVTLSVGRFVATYSSGISGNRIVTFGTTTPGNIQLTGTTVASTVLDITDATQFTCSGPGGFTVNAMNNTRTFTFGTTGGSTTNAPNLTFTTGASIATLTTASWFKNLDFGTTSFTLGTTALNNTGNLTLSSSGTYTGLTSTILGTSSITTNAKTISALYIGVSALYTGTATLTGALTLSGTLNLLQGSLTCSTYNVQSAFFTSTGTSTRTMSGSGTYTITGAGATAFSNASATGITITGLTISMTAATAKTFAGGGGSYPTLNQGGAGALTISGNNSFADLTATTRPSTITFTASSTQTFTNFTLSGILGSLVTINSSTPGTRAILSKSSGTVSVNYLSIQDSNATGGAAWYAGTTSTNVSNNLGWIFTAPPTPGGAYAGNFFAFF
jgi:hypothetical protein